MPDPTAPERHELATQNACRTERDYGSGIIHVCEQPGDRCNGTHSCRCGLVWTATATVPADEARSIARDIAKRAEAERTALADAETVTAEDLRERVAEKLWNQEQLVPWSRVFGNPDWRHDLEVHFERVDELLAEISPVLDLLRSDAVAALAGDPGDLPARMAEAQRERDHWKREHDELFLNWQILAERTLVATTLVAEGMPADVEAELAPVRLEVLRRVLAGEAGRDDLTASLLPTLAEAEQRRDERTGVEVERLRAELAEAQERLNSAVVQAEAQFTTRLEEVAERDALKATIERVRAIPPTPQDSDIDPIVNRIYRQGWESVIDAIDRALAVPESHEDAPTGGEDCRRDVFVASRTHELRVFTGSIDDAREFAAGLVEQLRDQGPVSRNPYVPTPANWTPEGWRQAKDDSASRFRQGVTSCAWFGPAGLEVRIEDAPTERPKLITGMGMQRKPSEELTPIYEDPEDAPTEETDHER
jgi:hypothetical protein